MTELVEHKTVRDYRLEGNVVKYHCGDSVERIEPTTCLVNAFSNEVGGIASAVIKCFLVFEGIVNLRVRHSTRVKPNVDEVEFASEHLTRFANELDVIYIGAVQVDKVIVCLVIIARHETLCLQGIFGHHASCNCLFNFVVEFFYRTDANLFAAFGIAPNGKGSTPIA